MKTNQKPSAVLRRGIRRLKKYGWIQGRSGNTDVGFCMVGAIVSRYHHVEAMAIDYLREVAGYQGIVVFNDNMCKSANDATAAMAIAADLAEADGR